MTLYLCPKGGKTNIQIEKDARQFSQCDLHSDAATNAF
jgi:hypothetical protein